MPRGVDPYAIVEPSFVLGYSEAGIRFNALPDKAQLIYLRLWASCVTSRIYWFETGPASDKAVRLSSYRAQSKIVGSTSARMPGLWSSYRTSHLLITSPCGRYDILFGFKEKHARLNLKKEPWIPLKGNEEGACGAFKGLEKHKRNIPPPTPSEESDQTPKDEAPQPSGGGGGIALEIWEEIDDKLPAIRRRGIPRPKVSDLLAGKNGQSAIWLAALADACADGSVDVPLAVAVKRVESGSVKPATLATALAILSEKKRSVPYAGTCSKCDYPYETTSTQGRTIKKTCPDCAATIVLREVKQ